MFKIVQTIERGKAQLCIVPHKWEKRGKLYWPKMKADKLITEGDSMPAENWLEMDCNLKRNNLSQSEAKMELEIMLSCTDTDEVSAVISAPVQRRNKPRVLLPRTTNNLPQENFNEIAANIVSTFNAPAMALASTSISTTNNSMVPFDQRQVPLEPTIITISGNEILTSGDLPEVTTEGLNIPFMNVEKYDIIKNQEEILKNQGLILKQLATVSVQLDILYKRQSKIVPDLNKNKNQDFSFKLIETVTELETFEKNLADEEYLQMVLNKFSVIYGTSGREHGTNVCYALIDKFFSRKFMPQCSWAGGSRGKNKKIAFKTYSNVLNMFFKLVHAADVTFTIDACEQFFKNILKNSTKRSNIQGFRCSKTKRRPKNLAYKPQAEGQEHITADNNEGEEAESDTQADTESENEDTSEIN